MSKLRRPHPGNFSEDLDKLVAQLGHRHAGGHAGGDAERRRKYLPRRAARCPALHNRLLLGEVWR